MGSIICTTFQEGHCPKAKVVKIITVSREQNILIDLKQIKCKPIYIKHVSNIIDW